MLDELRCIYCGMCEEACPVDAIELTHIYDLTATSREEMMFDKEKLLEVYDETKDNPKDPVRTGRGRLGPASEFGTLPALSPATDGRGQGPRGEDGFAGRDREGAAGSVWGCRGDVSTEY